MTPKSLKPVVLCITDSCDLPESELFIGLHKAGLDIEVMANPKGRNYQRIEAAGVPVSPIALKGRFDREGTRQIHEKLTSRRFTVVQSFNPRALACSLRASRGIDVKIVVYRGVIGNVGAWSPESWITFLHPRVDRIMCVSDAVKQYFLNIRFLGKGIPPHKVIRVYKGHNLDWYTLPPANISEFGFPDNAFVFCCTGRDRPGKGFSTLIDAMGYLGEDSRVHLLLVGDLLENQGLAAKIRESRYPERIKLAGFRTDAPQVAAACDGLVLPSESEGLPRVVIEAMAYRRPVVVTEAGGMPELVRDGVDGLVVPVRDPEALAQALDRIARDPDLAKTFGNNGHQRISTDFNTGTTVQQTLELYQELTNELCA